ncbi:hypothetical protein MKX07_007674 [Trichoderma sp. CBMAI-0711]|nr:hypothetical protein MKX07_007674 [Trichoderma sp. CBMAI-0711]
MLQHEDYTVGWLCCITEEYVAAQSFLDEKHGRPEDVFPNDNNDYTLGTMGKHNVVIAVLPDGEYGVASAATVARDMLHTFPNVRIGLLVGIGGGAPSKNHDIRLGDVVVSTPRDRTTGGVLHYDFTKTLQDQRMETISYLNLPPTLLRTALNGLRAEYESDGHKIQESIDQALQKKPRLRKKYMRPDQSSDRLYQSAIIHPLSEYGLSCSSVCGNNPSNLVGRLDRTEDDDNPVIHYGLIASADQLLKDAVIRDKLAAEKEILCFETEAAGLMNHFPCLVIRGICDYSDSHGNPAWQGYAAMAAAAYAKNLLSRISINKVQAEKKIGEILSGVQEGVNKLLDIQHGQHEKAILDWLTPIDYASVQRDHIARRQPGTGRWFLDSTEYQAWLKGDRQTLFCPGIPGAGKTIITATTIDDIFNRFYNDTTVGIAYLYCDYRRQHEQTIEQLLSSLVKQLAQRKAPIPNEVSEIYSKYQGQPKTLPFDQVLMLLHSVSKLFSRVFVIVDALDECRADGCRMRFLNEIVKLQAYENTSIFLTARFIPDILNMFEGSAMLEVRAQDEDVQHFIANQITRLPSFVFNDTNLQNMIATTIAKAVDGMFLLAPLHMDALSQEPTVGHIESALKKLPRGLDEMYERAMNRVESQGGGTRDLAKKILAWVIHARRALSPIELQHAVAVEPGTSELDPKYLPSLEVISTICAGLITIDNQSNAVRYAARHWGEHSREASVCDEGVMGFLLCNAKVEASSQALMVNLPNKDTAAYFGLEEAVRALLESHEPDAQDSLEQTPLSYAAENGHKAVVQLLLDTKMVDVNRMNIYQKTPLFKSSENGHEAVVELLLRQTGISADSRGFHFRSPLSYAAEGGHKAVVELLLAKGGANPDSRSSAGQHGHEAVVKLLLTPENVNDHCMLDHVETGGRTALSYAALMGHEAIVRLLLSVENIDVHIKSTGIYDGGRSALSYAAENGNEAVVALLLAAERASWRGSTINWQSTGFGLLRTDSDYVCG